MSLIKHEILQPVRHFNMHNDPLTNIETLHLVLWDKGLCIAGYDLDQNVLTAKVYHYSSWNIAAIESIFVNEPLVAGPQPVTHTWIVDEREMIVPMHLYERKAAEEWLRRFHFIEAGELVRATEVKQGLNAVVSYPIQEKLVLLLQKYFAESKTEALSRMILCQEIPATKEGAELVFFDEKAMLTVYKQGKLQLHQITEGSNIHNLLYKIGTICQELELKPDALEVTVSGLRIEQEALDELKSFLPQAIVPGSEQTSSFTLLSKLITCVL